jgi:hypothetical protein
MDKLLYAEKRLYKELTVTVMGKQKKLPISDIDDHLVGVMFVYDNEDKAKEEAGDTGYLVLENGGPAQSKNKKEE